MVYYPNWHTCVSVAVAVRNLIGKTGVLNMNRPRKIRICSHPVCACLPNKTVYSYGNRLCLMLDLCVL